MSKRLALKELLFGEVGRHRTVTQVVFPGARAGTCREPFCFRSGGTGGGSISKMESYRRTLIRLHATETQKPLEALVCKLKRARRG